MKKLQEKQAKINRFTLHWDKNAQSVLRQREYDPARRNTIPHLEEYFEFLSDIEPLENLSPKPAIAEKQFTL